MFISFLTRREMAFVRYLTVLQLAVIVLMLLNTLLVRATALQRGNLTSPAIATSVSRLSLQRKTSTVGGDETLFLPLVRRQSEGQITGNVFDDRNYNGTHETDERGVSNVTVAAYDESGTRVRTTTTENGRYTLKGLRRNQLYRVEFTNVPAPLVAGPHGTDSRTTVAFTTATAVDATLASGGSGSVDLALVNTSAATSCTDAANLTLATSCYAFGEPADEPSIITFPYNSGNDGSSRNPADYDGPHPVIATTQQVGAVNGLAYNGATNTLYAAAFIKRHSALGPDGPGAIYQLNLGNNTASTLTQIDAVGSDPHPSGTDFLSDPTFAEVGSLGLGDLELSADQTMLYALNLNTRNLIAVSTATGEQRVLGVVPDPGCVNGEARPFALAIHEAQLYIGGVCTAETGGTVNDLQAYVYRYSPVTATFGSAPVLIFPLDYPRGCTDRIPGQTACKAAAAWQPWVTNFSELGGPYEGDYYSHPQPWLTDIEFDGDAMVLGFRDRMGDLLGVKTAPPPGIGTSCRDNLCSAITAGDLLRAVPSGDGWQIENNATAGSLTTGGANNGDGPGNGEYYWQDAYDLSPVTPRHNEITQGGLVQVPNQGDIVTTSFNPIPIDEVDTFFDGGILWLANATGRRSRSYRVYNGVANPATGSTLAGKNNGLGDLEVLCAVSQMPIEIGNRVWLDVDHNGVQDPDEVPLAEIVVQLFRGSGNSATLIGTTTTAADGTYYFGGVNDRNLLPGNSLAAQSAYELRISLTDPNLPALAQPTLANATFLGDGNDDLRDADGDSGERNPGFSTIVVTTGSNGVNDHTYDFGFYVPAVAIGNLVWLDNGAGGGTAGDGAINGDEQGIAGVPVELYAGTVASGTPLFAMTTNADGFYLFDRLPPNDYVVHIPATAFVPGAPLYDSALATPYRSSQPNGADTADDDNRDENGQNRPPAILTTSGISSTVVNLAVGAEPIDEAGRQDATQSILPDANVNLTVDFAFWSPPRYSVGNRVWLDDGSTGGANTGVANNGIQDGMEPGIGAVAVELRSSSDAVISTTVTDDNGYYRFDDLLPGAYQVVLPSINFSGTAPLAGLMSSSGAVTTTTNTVDQRDNGIDAVGPAATGIRSALFILPLPSGNPLAEPDVTASGRGAHGPAGDGNDNLVIDFGFVPVPELVAVGNMVWLDDGAGNGVRGDGIINGTEAGIAGVELQLFADAIITGTPLQTTTTMTDGRYLFANLQPGRYGIHIPGSQFAPGGPLYDTINNRPIPSSPPEGGDTPNDDNTDENGQNTLPNDLMQLGVSSTVFALQPNSEPTGEAGVAGPPSPQDDDNTNLTIDFGFGSGFTTGGPVAVGNLVWLDDGGGGGIAGDGVVNGAETGISAVEVQLFEGDSVVGQPFITTTTDAAGRYLFDRLPEGTYVIHIPGSEFIGNGPLAGLVSSIPQGSDTPDDDNADENGQNTVTDMLGTVGVSSTAIELRADTEPTNEAGVTGPPSRQDDDNTNTTVDFGFWPQVTSYSVGNRVWLDDGAGNLALFDNGVQDVGEVGIAGVTIALRAGSGSVLATTVTDEAGYYRFDGVPANSGYTIFLPPTNFASDGALHTFTVSSRGATDTASNRIDQHDNGIDDKQAEVNGISSAPFTVPLAGGVPIGEPDVTADGAGAHGPSGDANDNLVIDFGFVSCQNGPLVLPDLLFLGPEPPESLQGQTYTLPEGYEQLVVKKFGPSPIPADELRYHFAIEDSPYTTANREPRSPERVWACKGNGGDRYPNQCTLTAAFENRVPLDQIGFNAGNLQAGDVIDMIVIDDDDDTRTQSWVALDENGDIVTEIPQVGPQALVEQIRFEIPQLDPNEQARIATWAYNAVDSIGVVGICVR